MSPELRGEILGWNLFVRNDHPQRIARILRKLDRLLTAADALQVMATAALAQEERTL